MVTIFCTWDGHKQRWKFRDCVRIGSKGMQKRKRKYQQCTAFIRVSSDRVEGLRRHQLAKDFYAWQCGGVK